ncbi:MAG TPA: cation:proton antiporter [Acetobacteraceae bacterium]|jgi:Kef-type K+ transport system membrane component KefB|nr:cation:proton antiporter [Acetobacteraceae bacterium]
MDFIAYLRAHDVALPSLAKFAIALAVIVGVPPLSRRARLPAVVGLLLCGVLLGPYGLDVIGENRPIADFLSEIGKLLLMFFCGLEIDLLQFRRAGRKTGIFGLLTTLLPQTLGTLVGLALGYGPLAAVVLGSLLASHTLLGSSIVARLGASRLEPVTVTVGATVISDTLSLIIFAVCLSTYQSGFSVSGFLVQVAEIAVFVPLVLFGLSRAGAALLKRSENQEDAYFILMLAMVAVAGLFAQLVNLPGIVGAFLAGLAVNAAVKDKPAKEKLEFVGNTFFVPIFFIVTGFLIDPPVFVASIIGNFPLVAGIIGALLLGKWLAVEIAGRAFGYSRPARMTMWSLTLPQVAATLAAALVAYDTRDPSGTRLLDVRMLNAVLVLMLVTSILGPVLTERFLPRLLAGEGTQERNRNAMGVADALKAKSPRS